MIDYGYGYGRVLGNVNNETHYGYDIDSLLML